MSRNAHGAGSSIRRVVLHVEDARHAKKDKISKEARGLALRALLPHFKYHPDPLATGNIQQRQTLCPVCEQVREYVYVGPFWAKDDVSGICPWCIKDGSAATKYRGAFQNPEDCEEAAPEFWDELLFRTPGYLGWEQPLWPIHHHDFCVFLGYMKWKEIESRLLEFAEDIDHDGIFSRTELYQIGNRLEGYLFQCVVCGKHRLIVM
jgi:uncharacterized protein CbrC (UPF0167 family)